LAVAGAEDLGALPLSEVPEVEGSQVIQAVAGIWVLLAQPTKDSQAVTLSHQEFSLEVAAEEPEEPEVTAQHLSKDLVESVLVRQLQVQRLLGQLVVLEVDRILVRQTLVTAVTGQRVDCQVRPEGPAWLFWLSLRQE
jgi:hypothetical protein